MGGGEDEYPMITSECLIASCAMPFIITYTDLLFNKLPLNTHIQLGYR